jgi:hypothetical protein
MREAEWQSREPDFKSTSIASNMSEESAKDFSMPLKSTYQQQNSALTSNEQLKEEEPKGGLWGHGRMLRGGLTYPEPCHTFPCYTFFRRYFLLQYFANCHLLNFLYSWLLELA